MSNDLEARVERLEKVVGASGYNIHEFDNPDQAGAHTLQQLQDRLDEVNAEADRLQAQIDAGGAPAEVAATPAAVQAADEHGVDLASVEGTGAEGKVTKADVVEAATT